MLYVPYNDALKPMSNMWQEVLVSITPGKGALYTALPLLYE